jgi:hypothetical protein
MNSKGFGRKRPWYNLSTIVEFSGDTEENNKKPSFGVFGVSPEVRTENILNTCLERYLYTNLHGKRQKKTFNGE